MPAGTSAETSWARTRAHLSACCSRELAAQDEDDWRRPAVPRRRSSEDLHRLVDPAADCSSPVSSS